MHSEKNSKTLWRKSVLRSSETWRYYNCEVINILSEIAKNHCERKKLTAINKKIVHNQFNWTACYNDMCWVHKSEKMNSDNTHRNYIKTWKL
jgi:hypothetical protein